MSKEAKKLRVPKLRFPEFRDAGEWEEKRMDEIADVVASGDLDSDLFSPTRTEQYVFPVYSNSVTKEGLYGYYACSKYEKNSVTVTARGTLGIAFSRNHDFMGIGRLLVLSNLKNIPSYFLKEIWNFSAKIPLESGGIPQLTAVKAKSVSLNIPKPPEQQKIADCLASIDDLIIVQTQKIGALKAHKKGLMQQLFPREDKAVPKLRFPKFRNAGKWEEKPLGEYLSYQQPTAYLVSDTKYSGAYKTPVLTAGKTFILGYTNEQHGIFSDNLPVIIFDDFTTATQFVDFPFKAKSSAMKILQAKDGANIKFMYEAMQIISYKIGVHERHWISKFAPMPLLFPKLPEQQKIADCLSSIDELITAQSQKLEALKTHKKGLMQQLFSAANEEIT